MPCSLKKKPNTQTQNYWVRDYNRKFYNISPPFLLCLLKVGPFFMLSVKQISWCFGFQQDFPEKWNLISTTLRSTWIPASISVEISSGFYLCCIVKPKDVDTLKTNTVDSWEDIPLEISLKVLEYLNISSSSTICG